MASPKIPFKIKFYPPKNFLKNITLENIKADIDEKKHTNLEISPENLNIFGPQTKLEQKNIKNFLKTNENFVLDLKSLLAPKENGVCVRFLFHKKLNLWENPLKPIANGFIFHIHGGGFVAGTSSPTQSYTRKYFFPDFSYFFIEKMGKRIKNSIFFCRLSPSSSISLSRGLG